MDIGYLLQGTKWDILSELVKNPQSPKDLALRLKTSIANVQQQLALLEAHGIVTKAKEKSKGPGKPKTKYSLKQDIFHVAALRTNHSLRKSMPFIHNESFISFIRHASIMDKDDAYYFLKFLYANEDLVRTWDALGFVKTNTGNIELLVITENLKPLREQFANQTIKKPGGGEKKVVIWSHNAIEIEEGLLRKDPYFTNYIGKIDPLHDSHGVLKVFMR
ncbi:MAG: winged helix-turn-helix domain-containing protein [Nanoarchaeota archaeon]